MEWFRDHAWESWLALAVVLGVAEMFSLDLVLAMLALGALVGMLAALLDLSVTVQVLAAAAAAVAGLWFARPSIVKRLHGGPELSQGHQKVVGQTGLVTEEITVHRVGRVKVAGEVWSAVSQDDATTIPAGATVQVTEIRGATAVVSPLASHSS